MPITKERLANVVNIASEAHDRIAELESDVRAIALELQIAIDTGGSTDVLRALAERLERLTTFSPIPIRAIQIIAEERKHFAVTYSSNERAKAYAARQREAQSLGVQQVIGQHKERQKRWSGPRPDAAALLNSPLVISPQRDPLVISPNTSHAHLPHRAEQDPYGLIGNFDPLPPAPSSDPSLPPDLLTPLGDVDANEPIPMPTDAELRDECRQMRATGRFTNTELAEMYGDNYVREGE